MDFVLGAGASYMEDDVRAETDKMGFCRTHYKKMYDYGNRLGTGLILKTHFQYKTKELHEQIKMFAPSKASVFSRFKKGNADTGSAKTSLGAWAKAQEESCYICNFYKDTYARYLDTFFDLFKKNPEFLPLFKNCKGFCIPHFGDLVETAETALSDKEKKAFYDILFPMMEQNMQRLSDDLDWFCDKFDYRNKDADWRTSQGCSPPRHAESSRRLPGRRTVYYGQIKSKPQAVLKLSAQPAGIFTTQNMFSISSAIIL